MRASWGEKLKRRSLFVWRFLKILRENAETSLLCLQLYEQQGKEKKTQSNIPKLQMLLSTAFHKITKKYSMFLE